jgi:drug/metabolite transporter (DMT)-like permease
MTYLIFGIISNTLIFLAFRSYTIFKIDNLQAIVVNYYVCVITGLIFIGEPDVFLTVDFGASWSWLALFMGLLLVIGFYAASLTSQLLGVSVTSISSKMSMVFPILFSLIFMKIESKSFSVVNYSGMALAVFSIYLSSIKKTTDGNQNGTKLYLLFLPFVVFAVGGMIDICLNYSNHKLLTDENEKVFPILLFACAALIGTSFLIFQKKKIEVKNIVGGIYLGIPNYFALFFVLKALTVFQNNGAVFFPIYNVGIILLSSFTAMIIFKEKLSKINFVGLILAVLSLIFVSYQEIIEYFDK